MSTRTLSRVALVLSLLLVAFARAGGDEDRWYEIWIEGARSGWMHETATTEGDRITSRSEMRLTLARAGDKTEITQTSEFVETLDGKPIEATSEQRFGPMPIAAQYEFRESDVVVRSAQNGAARETTMDLPEGEWLPPAAAGAYVKQRLLSGATEMTVRTIDPTGGLQVVTTRHRDIKPADVEVLGRTVKGYTAKSTTTYGQVQIPASEWYDAEGTLVRNETSMGALSMTMIASTRERALLDAEPAELMITTFVKPNEPIRRPRASKHAVYAVSIPEGSLAELPQSGAQAVETTGEGSARVTVDVGGMRPAGDVSPDSFLAATTYADAEDEVIHKLADEALAGAGESPADRAEALRRFVFKHIKSKDLTQAFATASETARSCQGDCSEHGVLLAAMLRAADIPSRVVAGVVYVDEFAGERGVFGYHMWTQALVEGESGPTWLDLDATLDASTPFDATHIAFAASDLGEGDTVSALAGIAPLLGALEIRVEEVR